VTIDPETLMAFADGELDPLAAKRVERAIAEDPALAEQVAAQHALRARLSAAFAPLAEEAVPDALAARLRSNVVTIAAPAPRRVTSRWREALALAACLTLGVLLGQNWRGPAGPVAARDGALYASGPLAASLDTQLAATQGSAPVRVLASFRATGGEYCRVFAASVTDGIACHDAHGWALRQTCAGAGKVGQGDYRQAGSSDPALLAAAQDMMAGEPLDAAGEAKAKAAGWR
jgi:anti-sigma factor RsiW